MKDRVFAAMLRLSGAEVPDHDAIATAIVERAAVEQLDPLLLVALAFHESRFRVGAVNKRSRCRGLFQLSPYWFRGDRLPFVVTAGGGGRALLEVAQGASVFRHYMDKTGGDHEKAISAFNGRGPVRSRWARLVLATWRRLDVEARRS